MKQIGPLGLIRVTDGIYLLVSSISCLILYWLALTLFKGKKTHILKWKDWEHRECIIPDALRKCAPKLWRLNKSFDWKHLSFCSHEDFQHQYVKLMTLANLKVLFDLGFPSRWCLCIQIHNCRHGQWNEPGTQSGAEARLIIPNHSWANRATF